MLQTVETLALSSKVWIYLSPRPFSDAERGIVNQALTDFVNQWQSHGAPVTGAYEVVKNQFIVLMADEESSPSGCSIDSSVKIIRELESELQLPLLDKSLVAFEGSEGLFLVKFNQIKKSIADGLISEETPFYDNSISDLRSYQNDWMKKAGEGWVKRYFS